MGNTSRNESMGDGSASFVLLHGFAQTPRSWDAVACRLRQTGHAVHVPDLLGGNAEFPSLAHACAQIEALVEDVADSEGAPMLVGYSMGGRLVAEALVRFANLPVSGIVLESAGLGPQDDAARAQLEERNLAWAKRLLDEGVPAFMDWWEVLALFASQQTLPEQTRAAVRAEREAHAADVLAACLREWGAHRQTCKAKTLAALNAAQCRGVKVTYVAGGLDEKYTAVARHVRAAGIPAHIVNGAGHNVHLEAPEAFLEVVLRV